MAKIVVPILSGFEEIEAVTIIDVLRRANLEVTIVSDSPGPVVGAHGIAIVAGKSVTDLQSDDFDMAVLPGGMPGASNLAENSDVIRLLQALVARNAWVAAICAAPMVLGKAGLLQGKRVTCFPGFEKHLNGGIHSLERVVVDGKIVTSRGPGTALEFALRLVSLLVGVEEARKVAGAMLFQQEIPSTR